MDWKELADDARVWIYQADRLLNDEEVNRIQQRCAHFVKEWSSHGNKLEAAIDVFHHLFVVVFVDEKKALASGCSIDKSVNLIRDLETEFKLNFTNRMLVAVKRNGTIELVHLHSLKIKIANRELANEDLVYNNLVNTKKDFVNSWLLPINSSWHKQFVE